MSTARAQSADSAHGLSPAPAPPPSDPIEERLDEALALTFPASDPTAVTPPARAPVPSVA